MFDALADGSALTAGDIATVTGLGRGSVSTTLSNLLAAGQVLKADRGYNPRQSHPRTADSRKRSRTAGQPPAGTDPGLAAIRSELAAGLGSLTRAQTSLDTPIGSASDPSPRVTLA